MTDSLTRAAGTRWHHGPPGAAVALRAAAARRLPGSAAAEAVYLRAGIGLTRPADTQFTDADCSSLVPAALYGCGLGVDDAPHRSVGDVGTVAGLELGRGYAVSSAVRLEALVGYRPRFTFDGRANFLDPDRRQSVSADLAALSGILAPVFPSKKEGIGLRGAFVVMARRLCGEGVRAPFLSSLAYPGQRIGIHGGARTPVA